MCIQGCIFIIGFDGEREVLYILVLNNARVEMREVCNFCYSHKKRIFRKLTFFNKKKRMLTFLIIFFLLYVHCFISKHTTTLVNPDKHFP